MTIRTRAARAKRRRVRRSPDEARALILRSAEQVFAGKGPDVAGLKDVAKQAGVSHALVTHYFGTFEQLVMAVVKRRVDFAQQEATRLMLTSAPGPEAVLRFLIGYLSEPVQVRLTTWALLSGRHDALLPIPHGALGPFMEALAERRRTFYGDKVAQPRVVELDVTLSLAAAYGFAIGRELFAAALGREPLDPQAFAVHLAETMRHSMVSRR